MRLQSWCCLRLVCPLLKHIQSSFSHLTLGLLSLFSPCCPSTFISLPITCSLFLPFSVALPLSLFFNNTSKYLIKFDLGIYIWRSVDFRDCIFCFPWRIYIFYIWTNNMNMFPWCIWIQRTAWRPEVTMHLLSEWHSWDVVSLLWAVETIGCKHYVCGYYFKCWGN